MQEIENGIFRGETDAIGLVEVLIVSLFPWQSLAKEDVQFAFGVLRVELLPKLVLVNLKMLGVFSLVNNLVGCDVPKQQVL